MGQHLKTINKTYRASYVKANILKFILIGIGLTAFVGLAPTDCPASDHLQKAADQIGKRDAILVTDPDGKVLISKNENNPLIPASTLKVFTSLVALNYLGADYRFATDFYLDSAHNLIIKGYGDPLLISEIVADIVQSLSTHVNGLNDIILDDSYFSQPLAIPGVSSSSEPYDAPNGALCVNFNTVTFKKVNNQYISAEQQSPLLPIVLNRVKATKQMEGRIVLSHDKNQITLYSGHLFAYFLERNRVPVSGQVKIGKVRADRDRLILRHLSPFTLVDVIERLLEYSNNYITNQILIAAGISAYGEPGTIEKGVRAALAYADQTLHLKDIHLNEGSGISRANRIRAKDLSRILEAFSPYYTLMRHNGRQYYKSGTLHGISTRVGYIENPDGRLTRFVVLLNSKGKSADRIARRLVRSLN
jgi:D-alanyl-D-alanine carboxypeptidase/D-alanyl-D-alanine-endopeptidase (penicillin-binding protein 4)